MGGSAKRKTHKKIDGIEGLDEIIKVWHQIYGLLRVKPCLKADFFGSGFAHEMEVAFIFSFGLVEIIEPVHRAFLDKAIW